VDKDKSTKIEDMLNPFKGMKSPVVDFKGFMSGCEENFESLKATQKMGMETVQALMEIQSKYMQNLMNECNELAKNNMSQESFQDRTARHSEIMKEASTKSLEQFKEINALFVKSNEEMIKSCQETFNKATKNMTGENKKTEK
jgi:phasin family protein